MEKLIMRKFAWVALVLAVVAVAGPTLDSEQVVPKPGTVWESCPPHC